MTNPTPAAITAAEEIAQTVNDVELNSARLNSQYPDKPQEGGKRALLKIAAIIDRHMQSQWQPIESAPKDIVCDFWLEWADDTAPLNPPLGSSQWKHDQLFRGKFGTWGSVYKATHWQPLPEGPKE